MIQNEWTEQIAALKAENEWLREALKEIAECEYSNGASYGAIAREALKQISLDNNHMTMIRRNHGNKDTEINLPEV